MQLASRFGRINQIRRDRPLTHEELMSHVPSVFGSDKHESRSDRYTYIPTVEVLDALRREIGSEPADFDVLQGTSCGAELVTMLGGGASLDDLLAMQRGEVTDPRLRAHLADTPRSFPSLPLPRPLNPRLLRTQSGLDRKSVV